MPTKIVVGNRVHSSVRAHLASHGDLVINESEQPMTTAALMEACRDADALMAFMTERVDAAFLDACPRLRVIGGALKGYNNLDVAACTARGVVVTNVPDLLTEPTAELTVAMMIGVARNIIAGDAVVRSGGFAGWRPTLYGGSLSGATVGMIGAGAVGRSVLRMLEGFRCERLYTDTKPMSAADEATLRSRYATKEELLARSDFVVLGLHLTPDTLHLVDDAFLASMKPGAYLINPARGSLVDEAAVARALDTGGLAGYASDTFELEDWQIAGRPERIADGILQSSRTMLTPHIGSAVTQVREEIELSAADSIIEVLAGRMPRTAVNPEAQSAARMTKVAG